MPRKMFDLAVKTGEYTTASGETKGRWQNVGAVFEGDNGGMFVLMSKWFNPAGVPDLSGRNSESVMLSCFEPKAQEQHGQQRQQQPAPVTAAAPARKNTRSQFQDNPRSVKVAPAEAREDDVPF